MKFAMVGLLAAIVAVPALGNVPAANEELVKIPDPASVAMPKLDFVPTPADEADFDKYYVFHREATNFPAALTDLRDCDNLARGLSSGVGYAQPTYPYTAAGAIGGAIGNAMVAAIFGSAEKRRIRRVNMRRCMSFKGYRRYGLRKELWEEFNFEEGFSGFDETKRQAYLAQQAKVASGSGLSLKEVGR